MVAVDDADMVGHVLSGDREAYRVLVERYLGACPEVEEQSQEAFFRVYRHLDRCAQGSFGPYLLTTDYHLAVDHLRRRREWPVDDQKLIALVGATGEGCEDALLAEHRSRSLQEESFAAVAKNSEWATLVGSATRGDGVLMDLVLLDLPNSGLLIRFPLDMGLNADGTSNWENGTQPDVAIKDGEDALDVVLQFITGVRSMDNKGRH